MAGRQSPPIRRHLAANFQKGFRRAHRHLPTSTRRGALLRMDRWPKAKLRWFFLAAEVLPETPEKWLVQDQHSARGKAYPCGTHEGGRPDRNRRREKGRPLDLGLRFPQQRYLPRGLSGRIAQKQESANVLRLPEQSEPLRDFLSSANRQEAGNQAKAHENDSGDAGKRRGVPLRQFARQSSCAATAGLLVIRHPLR